MKIWVTSVYCCFKQRWSPWGRARPRGHILKSLASKAKSLALASKPQVLENWPVLGSRTALFFELLKFCGAPEKLFGRRYFLEIAWKIFLKTFFLFLEIVWRIFVKTFFFGEHLRSGGLRNVQSVQMHRGPPTSGGPPIWPIAHRKIWLWKTIANYDKKFMHLF